MMDIRHEEWMRAGKTIRVGQPVRGEISARTGIQPSAAGFDRLETPFGQLVDQQLDMLTLDLDDPVLERPARAAAAFQRAGQLL